MNNSILSAHRYIRLGSSGQSAEQAAAAFVKRVQSDGGVVEGVDHLTSEIQHLKDIGVWDKLSAAWIPSGYAEGKLYAVKGGPEADLGFTRAGTRTRVGPSGLVEEVPYNLFLHTNFSYVWNVQQATLGGTIAGPLPASTGTLVIPTNVVGQHRIFQGTIQGRYFTVYAKNGGYRYLSLAYSGGLSGQTIIFDLDTGTYSGSHGSIIPNIERAGDGWFKCSLDVGSVTSPFAWFFIPRESNNTLDYEGDGVKGVYLSCPYVGVENKDYFPTTNRQHVPAIDFYSGAPSLSLEKASTNLLRSSNDFGNSTYWTNASSIGITPASILSPKGILNGVKLTEANTTANHQLVQGIGKTGSALQYTLSVYAKKAERNWIRLQVSESANGVRVWFNLDTGEIGTTLTYGSDFTLDNAKISPYKDGWYRCEVTCTSNASTSLNSVIAIQEQDNFTSYAGDGESGIYVYQAQLEQGAYATSDIPTTTATASRVADSFSGGISISNSGTLYFEGTVNDNTTHKYLSISDGTTGNRIGLGFRQQGVIWGTFGSGGSVANLTSSYPYSPKQKYKIAITWIDSTIKLIVDGEIRSTSNTFVMPIGVDRIITGNGVTTNSPFYGNIERLAICDYLTDDEAITLTAP